MTDSGKVHALIVGVSDYTHLDEDADESGPKLGLQPLESAALAAFRVHEWIAAHGLAGRDPGDVQLLVAPSACEIDAVPAVAAAATACTWDAVADAAARWRRAASGSPEDAALFYFAGHGLQRLSGDHVLLCQDFGDGRGSLLHRAIDSDNVIEGMPVADAQPDIARLQFYVFDACRATPPRLRERYESTEATRIWDPLVTTNEQRALRRAPTIHTAVDGMPSYGIAGYQSVFSEAFLDGLGGSAARHEHAPDMSLVWRVTTTSLLEGVNATLEQLAEEIGIEQRCVADQVTELTLYELSEPPLVELSVAVEPSHAMTCAGLELTETDTETTVCMYNPPFDPNPRVEALPAGYYRVRIAISPPDERFREWKKTGLIGPQTRELVVPLAAAG